MGGGHGRFYLSQRRHLKSTGEGNLGVRKQALQRPGESLSGRRKNTHEDPEGGEGIGGRGRSEPGDWE